MTIAGFDPSSGAGITADLSVFHAHRCFGVSALTALTVQSTMGVRRVQPIDAALLTETLGCLEEDLPPDGIKIGMLAGEAQVRAVAEYLRSIRDRGRKMRVVLDPVIFSSSGAELLTSKGLECLLEQLLPLVDVSTPNLAELASLSGSGCNTEDDVIHAMARLATRFPGLALVATGGDRLSPDDLLFEDGCVTLLRGTRIETRATHGTGCAFSSALLCGLVRNTPLHQAAQAAKRYLERAMLLADVRGQGHGPMQLLWPLLKQPQS